MQDRVHRFAGIGNFRDFGGYPTQAGGRVKHGILFRSAHFGEATPEDLERLDALGIGYVVDLRRNTERRNYPARWPRAGRPQLIVHDSGDEPEGAHITFLRDPEVSPAHVRAYMRKDYENYPFKDRYVALYTSFLKRLAAGEAPALVHCMAGKDRTGVICALLLKLLGVSEDHVIEDYLLTNRIRSEADFARRAKQFSQFIGRDVPLEVLRPMWMVEAEYLAATFAAIERECGSIEAYVERVLGVTGSERRALHIHCVGAA